MPPPPSNVASPHVAHHPIPDVPSQYALFQHPNPLKLELGETIPNPITAYTAYGTLNHNKSNAVLIHHGVTADQYLIGSHPVTNSPGWWSNMVGPNKPIDTNRFFVLCANALGGCMGSSGPASNKPDGTPYGADFPSVTIKDMVNAQHQLLQHLKIPKLFAVIGASMGGMSALQWASLFPHNTQCAVVIAAAASHSAQNIAFYEVGRQAIMADPAWQNQSGKPKAGLAVARMAAHITYMSLQALQQKFGRSVVHPNPSPNPHPDFQVKQYLQHQGSSFVERFNADSYIRLTRAMDLFDLAAQHNGRLADAFIPKSNPHNKPKYAVFSFSSDWHFPTAESRKLVRALHAAGASVSFMEINTPRGHDAFLLDEPDFANAMRGFLNGADNNPSSP